MKWTKSLKIQITKTHTKIKNLNHLISILKIKFVIKNLPTKKTQTQMASLVNDTRYLRKK